MKKLWFIVLLLAGCTSGSTHLNLEPRWAPVSEIVQANLPFVPDTATTTVGTKIYVVDLASWLLDHPVGDPRYVAILLHEREHARRQAKDALWFAKYLADPSFAWQEEQAGWRLEILWLRDHGANYLHQAEWYADALSSYQVPGGQMTTYDNALIWVRSILHSPTLTQAETSP